MKPTHTFVCGPVRVTIAHTAVTDTDHIFGDADGDSFRDRLELRLERMTLPVGKPFRYAPPSPLQFFFTVLRKNKDGSLRDVTASQIDPRHTGRPGSRELSFAQPDETLTDPISYFALATIMPRAEIVPGEYVVRIRGYDMITVDGTAYPSEPVEMPLTVRSVRNP